jgi:hypothetical protein
VAIYHLDVSAVSRSTGRSAVAAAAYRAGACLRDERTGLVHDYTRRRGVLSAEIVAPPGTVPFDRERLWQAAEAAEKRKDARTAREIRIALPAELDATAARDLARRFGEWLAERYRTVVDVAVHAPDRSGDQRNVHAHILMPTREIGADGTFGAKLKALDGWKTAGPEIEAIREAWSEMANRALAAAGIDARIDHRSLAEQGLDRAPTVHLGPAATHFERRTGEPSQIRERAEEAARQAEQARAAILDEQRAAADRVARLRERLAEARQALAAEREARRPSVVVRRAWSWVQQAAEQAAKAAAEAAAEATRQAAEGLRQAAATVVGRAAAVVETAGQAWRERMRRRQAEITRARKEAARPAPRPAGRRAEERPRVDEEARHQARHVDLARWCQAQGLTVEPDGRDHWKVRGPGGAGVCRITQRPGQHAVWTAWHGGEGGDAIAFVQWWRPGTSYREAVEALTGPLPAPTPAPTPQPEPARPTRPVVPVEQDRQLGRAYLASRGIDDATIRAAEQAGVLRYTAGAVLLVARDERGEARHILRRGYREDDPHPKRALAGSDTSHPVVLRGDPRRVVVVEGPITGLAAHSLARLQGEPVPTVVVTGGVAMRRWIANTADLLRAAQVVEIAAERETDPERQASTDAARARLAEAIQDATGRLPRITWPAPGCGDLADELAARRAEERRRLEEEERRLEEERRRQAEAEMLRRLEEARQRTEAAARRRQEEERRRQATPEMRRAEEQRRLQAEAERRRQAEEQRREQERQAEAAARRRQEEERRRHTPEARRAAILEEEMRRSEAQLAQARTSWEREAVETAARMRAMDRWRAEGIAPQEPRPSRRRQQDAEWEPPTPRM